MAKQTESKSLGTVLVIGGCGFLGSNVVDQLLNFPSEDKQPSSSAASSLKSRDKDNDSIVVTSATQFPSLRSRYPSYNPRTTTVHALDLRCTHNLFPNCTYHSADITDPAALLEVFRQVKPDVVINTASPHFDAAPAILRKVNIDGTHTLLEVAAGQTHGSWGGQCKAFVHTSSSSVVHDAESDLICADERYPYVCPNPREYYSETKVSAERMALEANGAGGMLTCAVRPAGIVGEGDRSGFGYSIVKTASIAPGWQLHLQLGNGTNLFDNTYVGNVAYGLLCAAEALVETWQRKKEGKMAVLEHEKVDGEAFNVTNDEPCYFWDTTRFLYSRYGKDVRGENVWALPKDLAMFVGGASQAFAWLTGRKGRLTPQTVKYACMHRYYSCEKLKKRCGYEPVVDLQEGLERTVKWFKEDDELEKANGGTEKKTQ